MRSYVTRALALISAVYLVGCDGGTTTDAAKSAEAPPPEEVAEVKTADSSTPAAVNTPAASPRR